MRCAISWDVAHQLALELAVPRRCRPFALDDRVIVKAGSRRSARRSMRRGRCRVAPRPSWNFTWFLRSREACEKRNEIAPKACRPQSRDSFTARGREAAAGVQAGGSRSFGVPTGRSPRAPPPSRPPREMSRGLPTPRYPWRDREPGALPPLAFQIPLASCGPFRFYACAFRPPRRRVAPMGRSMALRRLASMDSKTAEELRQEEPRDSPSHAG